jgi:hypothetical protein
MRLSNLLQIKEMNGGAGEARTPDLRFRNLIDIPQGVCFQSIQFGHSPALLGLFGRGICNAICNGINLIANFW